MQSSRGESILHGADLDDLNLLSVDNEEVPPVRRDRAHALADRIDGCFGRTVQFFAQDNVSRRLRGRAAIR
ncbi:MAG: hypothetical protein ACRDS9_21145 [Pseudonocardiaceae bacterium]